VTSPTDSNVQDEDDDDIKATSSKKRVTIEEPTYTGSQQQQQQTTTRVELTLPPLTTVSAVVRRSRVITPKNLVRLPVVIQPTIVTLFSDSQRVRMRLGLS